MNTKTNTTPAVLRRKIARLEALLAAEKERADKAFSAYREALYESVECKLKLGRIAAVLNGEDDAPAS